jgi:phospholipase/carboxylesterase
VHSAPTRTSGTISRRSFVAASGAAALATACGDIFGPADLREPNARLSARWRLPSATVTPGLESLGLIDSFTGRDGMLYVPTTYNGANASPLIVALHGANGSGLSWTNPTWLALLDEFRAVMIAPDSRHFGNWDLPDTGSYNEDVAFIDDAITHVLRKTLIDRDRIAILGFSAGASEALGLGVMNGDLFTGVAAFAPGMVYAPFSRGRTRVFISHGTDDEVFSHDYSRDVIAPAIKSTGVTTKFSGHAGGHTVLLTEARAALAFALSPF